MNTAPADAAFSPDPVFSVRERSTCRSRQGLGVSVLRPSTVGDRDLGVSLQRTVETMNCKV